MAAVISSDKNQIEAIDDLSAASGIALVQLVDGHTDKPEIVEPRVINDNSSDVADTQSPRPSVTNSIGDTALSGLLLLAVLYTFYFARALLLPVVLASLFSILLSPAVRTLRRARIPEAIGALIVMAIVIASLGIVVDRLIEPASTWLAKAPQSLSEIERKTRSLKNFAGEVRRITDRIITVTRGPADARTQEVVVDNSNWSGVLLGQTQYLFVSSFSTLILLYFLLASGDEFLRKLVRVLPSLREIGRAHV